MSEVLNEEVSHEDNEVITEPTDNTPQYSDLELKALEEGWRPKDEWEGDPDQWIDAGEYVRRGPLFEKIDSLNRQAKENNKVIKALQEHLEKVRQGEYKAHLEALRLEKKEALEEGDADRLIEIDEKIAEAKATEKIEKLEAKQEASQPDPRFVAWVNKNPWYINDQELQSFADEVGIIYKNRNPDTDPTDVLEYVSKRVQKEYPDKFKNERKARPNIVEGSGAPTTKKKDTFELSDEERKAMHIIVRTGALTEAEYIADLKKIKGIKE